MKTLNFQGIDLKISQEFELHGVEAFIARHVLITDKKEITKNWDVYMQKRSGEFSRLLNEGAKTREEAKTKAYERVLKALERTSFKTPNELLIHLLEK